MKTLYPLIAGAALALNACSAEPEAPNAPTNQADDFAARIHSGKQAGAQGSGPTAPSPSPLPAPSVAQPLDSIAKTPFAAGTVSDPNSACKANVFGEFLGREPSAEVRAAILEAASGVAEVRFVPSGGDYIKPDPTNPRLNFMIAIDGVIRDIRCG